MTRSTRIVLVAALLVVAVGAVVWLRKAPNQKPAEEPRALAGGPLFAGAKVLTIEAPRTTPHAYARKGDWTLGGSDGTRLSFAATDDAPGHRPLRGSVVDVDATADGVDEGDPLLWLKTGWRGADGAFHWAPRPVVQKLACASEGRASDGIAIDADVDGVKLRTQWCAHEKGVYSATTRAEGLAAGASVVDEVNPGTAPPIIDRLGSEWEGEVETRFLAFAEHGTAVTIEPAGSGKTYAVRKRVRIAGEVFPSAVSLAYPAGPSAVRTLRVARGDALTALAGFSKASREVHVGLERNVAGTVSIMNADGAPLATGDLATNGPRELRLPEGFGETCELRDAWGVKADARVPIHAAALALVTTQSGAVSFVYTDGDDKPVPVHVMIRGIAGTSDPDLRSTEPRVFASGRSLYLLDGRGDTRLP